MKTIYFLVLLGAIAAPLSAQTVEIPKEQQKRFTPVDSTELLMRYPKGKTWQALSVLRVNGTGRSSNWGIEGEAYFVQANRYLTQVKILDNVQFGQTATIKMRVDVIDAGTSKVVSKQRMRITGFDVGDPVLKYALNKADQAAMIGSPAYRMATILLKKGEQIDPQYERTLTAVARGIGISVDQLINIKETEWVENPRVYVGCAFELEWVNGFGVTKATQVKSSIGNAPKIKVEDIRAWAAGADPLAELYVFPSLAKRIGDKWQLDASRAASIFSGQGDAVSMGKINLRYGSNGSYDTSDVRNLSIVSGDVTVFTESDGQETRYQINSMEGGMKVDNGDAMLLMANGTGDISYNRLSTDHFLFKAELSKNVRAEWRYEAKRMD
ncbi:hypothetical protein Q31b_42650 [Novipirellula aureliae]|uniref:Uncharacterized protein n=1 Tax=Novipirellula aureliae TaxID=2527966 RepID=A0A5C6DNN1_9BACT|nr:hypothetical protein [Novipirellula aureliae]TWU37477.1 hypothetical protein Q31b_42650 [Novipirellula aureliae]